MHLQVFWKARSTFAQRFCQRQVQQVLKRQFGGNNISWKVVSVPKQKPGCVTFCDGNNPVSGLMQPNCRNWCPATTLGINLLGVVWSGSTPPGNSFNFFQFIGSSYAFYDKLVHSSEQHCKDSHPMLRRSVLCLFPWRQWFELEQNLCLFLWLLVLSGAKPPPSSVAWLPLTAAAPLGPGGGRRGIAHQTVSHFCVLQVHHTVFYTYKYKKQWLWDLEGARGGIAL